MDQYLLKMDLILLCTVMLKLFLKVINFDIFDIILEYSCWDKTHVYENLTI